MMLHVSIWPNTWYQELFHTLQSIWFGKNMSPYIWFELWLNLSLKQDILYDLWIDKYETLIIDLTFDLVTFEQASRAVQLLPTSVQNFENMEDNLNVRGT